MERLPLPSSHKPTSLLDMPYELRLLIYEECLPQKKVFNVYNEFPLTHGDFKMPRCDIEDQDTSDSKYQRSALPNLLLASRQISDEALNMLYGGNIFKVGPVGFGERHMEKILCEGDRPRIRHIMLVLRPGGLAYYLLFKMDEVMSDIIFPRLISLRIVAEQPIEEDYYRFRPMFQWDMTQGSKWQYWIKWLTPILELLAKKLSDTCTVLIDAGDGKETLNRIQKCLSPECRQIKTKTGDLIFKREEFSLDSGYWDNEPFGRPRHSTSYRKNV